ncbi:septal ring lytic transglycosylase RlpA family protein [Magnetospirillum sp. UT-4]|uniref:septal ring lytic transglycosylase RlpA family protein n=1 Tax=Magnetospirillum sp. UT-4 TaxID=2681467 RepID=UPI00138507E7
MGRVLALRGWAVLLMLTVAGCTTCEVATLPPPPPAPEPEAPPPPRQKPKPKGSFRLGEPYSVAGTLYTPAFAWDYDHDGIASWYGRPFHGRLTANGEIYDENDLTAAHPTLPLPSVVRVTNLENGRTLKLRVNDRGPFVDGRIIDVSRKAARLLKFHDKGVTRVRVEVMEKESRQAARAVGWRG